MSGFWPITKKVVKDADIVLIVLDARMPELSRNKELERMARYYKKKHFYVFNKIDLISRKALERLKKEFKGSFFVSGTNNVGIKTLKTAMLIEKKKGKFEGFKVGIVGYPNMGKSAIINALSKRGRTHVSSKAGTTTGIQWVRAGSMKVLDSPGVVPFEDRELSLALLGSKNVDKMKRPDVAAYKIIEIFLKRDKEALEKFYKIELGKGEDEYEILLKIGEAMGFLRKGAQVDEKRTEMKIIRDWQQGRLKF